MLKVKNGRTVFGRVIETDVLLLYGTLDSCTIHGLIRGGGRPTDKRQIHNCRMEPKDAWSGFGNPPFLF